MTRMIVLALALTATAAGDNQRAQMAIEAGGLG